MIRIVASVVSMILVASFDASACSTCFGDPQDPQTHGMNAAILTLLGVTYGLFVAMFAAGFVIWRRNRAMAMRQADPQCNGVEESTPEVQHG